MDLSKLPAPIEPVYSTDYPSQKVHLYEGEIKCSYKFNGNPCEFLGNGKIEYSWFPNPQAIFAISHNLFSVPHDLDDVSITLQNSNRLIPVNIQNRQCSSNQNKTTFHISGMLSDNSIVGKEDNLHSIIFHIVNFCKYIGEVTCKHTQFGYSSNKGRITLSDNDWDIVIDEVSLEENKSSEMFSNLKDSGGHAITHVGRIKKKDNSNFNAEEAIEVIEILSHFLSFARGVKVPIVLFVGYNTLSEKVYEQWNAGFSQNWSYRSSWLPKQDARKLSVIFPKFVSWWKDWGEAAQAILNMYLEANNNTFTDVTIILAHSILESMARIILVEKKSKISSSDYDKRGSISPAEKISLLLDELVIPLNFPPLCSTLIPDLVHFVDNNIPTSERKNKSASESLIVFTKIRNDITHANKKYNLSGMVFFDTANLGLWYVEMAILSILEYNGSYSNRLQISKWEGEYEIVPWSKSE
jgi:hypothetical protein